MKTIIVFLGIMLLWVSSPVFAADCPVGTYVDGDNCIQCEKGKYSDTLNADACTACSGNNTTTANVGATSENDCVCKLGFIYMAQGNLSGDDVGTMECTKCVSGTTTYTYGGNCEPIKEYKYGSAPGTKWKWPDTVEVGEIKITGNP